MLFWTLYAHLHSSKIKEQCQHLVEGVITTSGVVSAPFVTSSYNIFAHGSQRSRGWTFILSDIQFSNYIPEWGGTCRVFLPFILCLHVCGGAAAHLAPPTPPARPHHLAPPLTPSDE